MGEEGGDVVFLHLCGRHLRLCLGDALAAHQRFGLGKDVGEEDGVVGAKVMMCAPGR
jgi:hypothetical protein